MRQFGLIGKKLSHSFSKCYFDSKFDADNINDAQYRLYELKDISELPDFLNNNNELVGFNVTFPYKQSIIPFLDELSTEATKIGAVNTVKVSYYHGVRRLIGYNTDAQAFLQTIRNLQFQKALILGTGGAAVAVAYAIASLGKEFDFVSRHPDKFLNYNQLDEEVFKSHQLIVNCTPLGTFPSVGEKADIPYDYITHSHCLYDLVYNPSETAFLKEGKKRGAVIINGLEMLHRQAEASWKIWDDVENSIF